MTEKTIERADVALRFHTTKTDKFKMSRLSLNFILPADAEMSPKIKLMMSTIMRGSEKYPTLVDINKALDEYYGATLSWRSVAMGTRHVFKVSFRVLSDRFRFASDKKSILDGVCGIMLDLLFSPLRGEDGLLSRSNFESERIIAIDALKAKINDQKYYAADKCKSLMFGNDPAGISTSGTVEMLEKFTLEEVTSAREYLLKNSLIECYFVGSDDADGIIDLISERFVGLGREMKPLFGKETPLLREPGAEKRTLEESLNVSQCRLNIGCTCGTVMSDPLYYALCIFNDIFGGSSVSKLFMNVRERQSLCYYCGSSYSSSTGTLMIACGIKSENREKAYAEIENQLREMQIGNFTDEDIETAKKGIISGVMQTYDTPSSLIAFQLRRFLSGCAVSVEDCIENVKNVSKEDIVAVANRVKIDSVYFLNAACEGDEEEENEDE